MRCTDCGNGTKTAATRPQVVQKGSSVAVVTDVPVEECVSCGDICLVEDVALAVDQMLTEMLRVELIAVRPYRRAAAVTVWPVAPPPHLSHYSAGGPELRPIRCAVFVALNHRLPGPLL